ncbi:MAG TPA: tetraacyldisaccharide 4'-kinase, partial [Candidatus Binataceae bacterium]|nr:tetraacyldisaccharide 4'-kinase [Candidatus Binataceae bacterium]
LLAPLSMGYAGILAARRAWWERYARIPLLPTVSIGNLTVGGNGKSPFTLFLANRLSQRGLNVGIVSRGYGGMRSRIPRIVSDGRHLTMTPEEAGDEPVMMAKSFSGAIAVARRRIDAIDLLSRNKMADTIVLDDGFQHVRLRRDADLVLFNPIVGIGNGYLLPAGPLREPVKAIRRADAVVLIESPGAADTSISSIAPHIMNGKTLVRAQLRPSSMVYSHNGKWHDEPLMLDGRHVVAVSGIANNATFHAMVQALGAKLLHTFDYPDHYNYELRDWREIAAAAQQAELVLTTEKDLVKLERFALPPIPLYALRLTVTMQPDDENQLLNLVLKRIACANRQRTSILTNTGG